MLALTVPEALGSLPPMAGDAMKKNHNSLCMTLVLRLVIVIGAVALYLRGRLTPERDAA